MFKDYVILVGQFYIHDFKEGFIMTAARELTRIGF